MFNEFTPEQLFFREIAQFKDLSDNQIVALARRTQKKKYAAGENVFYQGDDVNALFFIEMGTVEVYKSDINGRKLMLWNIKEKEIFCLANLFSPVAFASAVALKDSLIYSLSQLDFEEIIKESPMLSHKLVCCISQKLAAYSSLLDDFAFKRLEVRLAKVLIRNFQRTENHDYVCSINQENLASMIGASREVISRCLKSLRERQIVTISKTGKPRDIIATDYNMLVKIAEEDDF
ncbi:MAG: Crp/Fnr family transcriptional regulator [Desulfuromusa sp.]